jgi:uncharacterized membrane protein HdeD (DUF308 family)
MAEGNIQVEAVEMGLTPKIAWQLQIFAGIITLGLGMLLVAHPTFATGTLCVILGLLVIVGGIFHFIRALDRDEQHRVWLGIVGLLGIVVGVVLIRHLDTARAFIGLLVGIVWIAQGVTALMVGVLGTAGRSRIWPILFGVISIVAGALVVSMPLNSTKVLAVLLGIWFLVMGILQLLAGLFLRHDLKKLNL